MDCPYFSAYCPANCFTPYKEIFTEVAQELVENRKNEKELTATRVPLSGSVESIETGIWKTIINILANAYVSAFQNAIDGDIDWKGSGEEKKDAKKKGGRQG